MTIRPPGDNRKRKILYSLRKAEEIISEWRWGKSHCYETLQELIGILDEAKEETLELCEDLRPQRPKVIPEIKNNGVPFTTVINDYYMVVGESDFKLPVGTDEDGNTFFLPISAGEGGGVLLHGGVDSEQTSLIYELILSACQWLSPDEIRIYIYTAGDKSYAAFQKDNPPYSKIPHLSSVSKPSPYDDKRYAEMEFLNRLHRERAERERLFRGTDANTLYDYNMSIPVLLGEKERLPIKLIILDPSPVKPESLSKELIQELSRYGIYVVAAARSIDSCVVAEKFATRVFFASSNTDSLAKLYKSASPKEIRKVSDKLKAADVGTFVYNTPDGQIKTARLASATVEDSRKIVESIIAKYGEK